MTAVNEYSVTMNTPEDVQPYGTLCVALCGLIGVGCTALLCFTDTASWVADVTLAMIGKSVGSFTKAAQAYV